jgi:hypothetical protein
MRRREVTITVVALVVLAATVPAVLAITEGREQQADALQRQDLVNDQVTSRQLPTDYDGDGIADSNDTCPTRAETNNGFQDGDGCPDIVATTGAS